jgi:hypothetical protein
MREIGIRVALGARTADVFKSVVASGIGVVVPMRSLRTE